MEGLHCGRWFSHSERRSSESGLIWNWDSDNGQQFSFSWNTSFVFIAWTYQGQSHTSCVLSEKFPNEKSGWESKAVDMLQITAPNAARHVAIQRFFFLSVWNFSMSSPLPCTRRTKAPRPPQSISFTLSPSGQEGECDRRMSASCSCFCHSLIFSFSSILTFCIIGFSTPKLVRLRDHKASSQQ